MKEKNLLTISEFSKISDVSRKALIFYDNTGLFSPSRRDQNGYRYYTHEQIYEISTIQLLMEIGMSHEEIKRYRENISIDASLEMLSRQKELIRKKIIGLKAIENLLSERRKGILEALDAKKGPELTKVDSDEYIIMSKDLDIEREDISDDEWVSFYEIHSKMNIPFGYNEGFTISKENLLNNNFDTIRNIVSYTGDKKNSNAKIEKGFYAISYGYADLYNTNEIYRGLLAFIKQKGLAIIGSSYEKRLIDETGSKNKNEQVVKIMIPVSTLQK